MLSDGVSLKDDVLDTVQTQYNDRLFQCCPQAHVLLLSVYVAAISASHVLIDGVDVGKHSLVACFIRGAKRLRLFIRVRIPLWVLVVVLGCLVGTPFKPLGF